MSFIAKYDGQCGNPDCTSGVIERGDEVAYYDDELMHVGCADRQRRTDLAPYCDYCHLHHRGEC